MNFLEKIFKPGTIIFLFTVPFMIICPLTLTSIFFGVPSALLQNNSRIIEYQDGFNKIELPQETEQIGLTFSDIGGFNIQDDNEPKCDLVSAKIIKSSLEQENLSILLLENYQSIFKGSAGQDLTEYLNNSTLKLFPLSSQATYFSNDGFEVNFLEDMEISAISLDQDELPYILYVINYDIYGSRDYRCKTESLPESTVPVVEVEEEDLETEDEPIETIL